MALRGASTRWAMLLGTDIPDFHERPKLLSDAAPNCTWQADRVQVPVQMCFLSGPYRRADPGG